MEAKRIVRPLISVLLVVASAAGLYNVFGDNTEVKQQAQTVACGKSDCAVTMTREARNPINQSFTFQTDVKNQTTVDVDCTRAYFLVGEYSCQKK